MVTESSGAFSLEEIYYIHPGDVNLRTTSRDVARLNDAGKYSVHKCALPVNPLDVIPMITTIF